MGTLTIEMSQAHTALEKEFSSYVNAREYDEALEQLRSAWHTSARTSKLAKLYAMLDSIGAEYEKGKDLAYYESLAETIRFLDFSEQEDKMLLALYRAYKKYPAPEKYMLRLVNRLSLSEDHWENDSLRLRILKQFIKYGASLSGTGVAGAKSVEKYVKDKAGLRKTPDRETILSLVDDGVFSLLDEASKDEKSGKYQLLKICDDLANGKFRSQGGTKKALYYFAMVYNMTFDSGMREDSPLRRPDADIESNLFTDYYTNNLIRFMTGAYRGNLADFEADPCGVGINYKNFAEMVYLYYIVSDRTPEEKILRSERMIARLRKTKPEDVTKKPRVLQSAQYRKYFRRDDSGNEFVSGAQVLSLPEDEYERFIADNFDCVSRSGNAVIGALQVKTEQNTAFRMYNTILKKLKKLGNGSLSRFNYGLWFNGISEFKKEGMRNICDRIEEKDGAEKIDREDFEKFIDVLVSMNRFMGYSSVIEPDGDSVPKPLCVDRPENMTRTVLLTAFYYLYAEGNILRPATGFKTLFDDFKSKTDDVLEKAHYQKISSRNFFDVAMVFSIYAYLSV